MTILGKNKSYWQTSDVIDDNKLRRDGRRQEFERRDVPGRSCRTAMTQENSCSNPEVQVTLRANLPKNDIKKKKLKLFSQ
jgi:hypothetical protein